MTRHLARLHAAGLVVHEGRTWRIDADAAAAAFIGIRARLGFASLECGEGAAA